MPCPFIPGMSDVGRLKSEPWVSGKTQTLTVLPRDMKLHSLICLKFTHPSAYFQGQWQMLDASLAAEAHISISYTVGYNL